MQPKRNQVAIIDYGMGNLFSVQQACHQAGMEAVITHDRAKLGYAKALILPGVGAFGDAMATLQKLELVAWLRGWIRAGKPFIGICLGMQLLMSKSFEFGEYEGLNVIAGEVIRFSIPRKVPQIGWNRIALLKDGGAKFGLANGTYMYFAHSYYVCPRKKKIQLTTSDYEGTVFCSGFHQDNVVAFQFHPERSGVAGLRVYQALAHWIQKF